jgi:putative transposase
MPLRKQVLATNEIYHIVNRGVASMPIFFDTKDYQRFLDLINYYRFAAHKFCYSAYMDLNLEERNNYFKTLEKESSQTIEIYSYCLMPNHFHLLVKQVENEGIKSTIALIQNAYAKYVNLTKNRTGPLFQSRFKAKWIETDEILLHISRYIHLNPCTSFMLNIHEIEKYNWSSYPDYMGLRNSIYLNTKFILKLAGGTEKYKLFTLDNAGYQQKLDIIKHLILEKY